MNGLLLGAHADKRFDRYLMSFEESRAGFTSVLHPRVRTAVASLGLRQGLVLDTSHLGFGNEGRFRRYMAQHLSRHRTVVEQDKVTPWLVPLGAMRAMTWPTCFSRGWI